MKLDAVRELVEADIRSVDNTVITRLHSQLTLINQIGHHIVYSGGKRLRPLLVLLAARAFNYTGTQHIELAAIVEFIHTATLLHDDVVDGSLLRRGAKTANAIWGNQASVLVGDFVYSRAFQMMVGIERMRVMEILANATNIISEGEVLQLLNCKNPKVTEEDYLNVIKWKTATLFEAAVKLGAVIADQDEKIINAIATYGLHLGIAFQLTDDALDYSASADILGKNIGDDLAEGKPTLPLIHVINQGTPEEKELVKHAIQHGSLEALDKIKAAIEVTEAIEYTYHRARQEAKKARESLQPIPESRYKDALLGLIDFAFERKY